MRNQDIRYSVSEIIGMANHSDKINIFVEGLDDVIWYKKFESFFQGNTLLFQVGGRTVLFDLYIRRNEIKAGAIFVADKDTFVFEGVPNIYREIIFTDGYSIENDLLKGSPVIHYLFSEREMDFLATLKLPLSQWFAFCIEELRNGNDPSIDVNPQCVLSISSDKSDKPRIRGEFKSKIGFHQPNKCLVNDIYANFSVKFRGKNLAQLYAYVLSRRKKKSDGCRYTDSQLLEMASVDPNSETRKELIMKINEMYKRVRNGM